MMTLWTQYYNKFTLCHQTWRAGKVTIYHHLSSIFLLKPQFIRDLPARHVWLPEGRCIRVSIFELDSKFYGSGQFRLTGRRCSSNHAASIWLDRQTAAWHWQLWLNDCAELDGKWCEFTGNSFKSGSIWCNHGLQSLLHIDAIHW